MNFTTKDLQTDLKPIPNTIHPFKNQDHPLLSVYVLPHPPDFLEGRQIFFKDYKIESAESKQIIIFNEKKEGKWIETKVNSEAVQWK
ncbi:MAG: hypothetical protein O9301_10295 [Leptospira sp.]|nr:hypothetical protein [Leptospira sp.]